MDQTINQCLEAIKNANHNKISTWKVFYSHNIKKIYSLLKGMTQDDIQRFNDINKKITGIGNNA